MSLIARFPESHKQAAFALVLIVAAVYAQSIDFGLLQWDDHRMVVANAHLQPIDGANLRWMFSDATYNRMYMPLGWLAYAVSIVAVGIDPSWQHAISVLMHVVNAALVYLVIVAVLRWIDPARGSPRVALMAALIWALHPLRVEVVAWVAARVHAQAAVLTLAALLCYLRTVEESDGRVWRSGWAWAALVLYAVGVLSFPAGLMLPSVLIVLDLYLLRRGGFWRNVAEKVPFFVIAMVPIVAGLWGRETGTIYKPAAAMRSFGLGDRAVQALFVWSDLAVRELWPVRLSPVYTRLIHFDLNSSVIWAGVAMTIIVTAMTFAWRRRWPLLWAAWLCHLLLVVPFLGLTEHPHVAADRYTYLDGVIWVTVLAVWVARLAAERRWVVERVAVAVAVVLAITTSIQLPVWRDSMSLFDHMVARMKDDPYRAQIEWRIADIWIGRHDYARGFDVANDAIAADPKCVRAWHMKVAAQRGLGDFAGAAQTLRAMPTTEPTDVD
jgi:hypothetical protein